MTVPTEIEMNLIVLDKSGLLTFLKQHSEEVVSYIRHSYFGKPGESSFYVRVEERKEPSGTSYY